MDLSKCAPLKGEITIPGDKSISHRSVLFGSIAKGTTEITGFLKGADCLSTIDCFRRMGVEISEDKDRVLVHGNGLHGLKAPDGVLDCGNSGTTTRLISGILAAQDFDVTLTGDRSIRKRPMKRIMDPLSRMGADITSIPGNGCAPLRICGRPLHGISYHSPVASAQVKSAILLAGLYADGETRVTEDCLSRDHTERMLKHFGADVQSLDAAGAAAADHSPSTVTADHSPGTATADHSPSTATGHAPGIAAADHSSSAATAIIRPADELYGCPIDVPGDISSAAFFIAAALLVPGSDLLIKHVGINPTRAGILTVCRAMGGDITLLDVDEASGEPTADLLVRHSALKGTQIGGAIIPTLIDELPMLAAMACFADGQTIIRDAAELKVKESDRIGVMVQNLKAMGADVTETADGMVIQGGRPLHGAVIDSKLDHRIAMTFAVASLCAEGETKILGAQCVEISYPDFYKDLARLTR